ncbi:MAG: enoyl-ACP reductase FabV, partial [Bacilli bacterium]
LQMIIKPKIKNNIALSAHPLGCLKNVQEQIDYIKSQPAFTSAKNVLIIGGSSGYGLASRIALAFSSNSFTYNVSYESAPKGKMTGSAGYFNNYYFKQAADQAHIKHYDLNADCFANETKDEVIKYFNDHNIKIDLIIYSVASGVRIDPFTKEKYVSALKPIDQSFTGSSLDIIKKELQEITVAPATTQEITNTINVMGGQDYLLWINALNEGNVLNENVKTIAYTYIGSPATYPIYKNGTIGQAKRDLEKTNHQIKELIKPLHGQAYICSSKSIVTKSSTYIPGLALYISALFKTMKEKQIHESIIQHKYRLFSDMIYGQNILLDEDDIIRLDALELDQDIQNQVNQLLNNIDENNLDSLEIDTFINDFLQINGFNYSDIDYESDIDLDIYI